MTWQPHFYGGFMITSTSNQQMKDLAALLKKSKERKGNKAFVVEGTKMVAEAPKSWLRKVYVSENYEKNPENHLKNDYNLK